MRRPWQAMRDSRFGAKLAYRKVGGTREYGLGWALIGRQPRVLRQGHETNLADPIAALIEQYRAESALDPSCEGVTLYRYASEAIYRQHRPANETLTHDQHNMLIDRAVVRLRDASVPVEVEIIRS